MDAERRQSLMAEYEDAKREREQLDLYIEVLARRLGVTEAGDSTGESSNGSPAAAGGGGPLADDVLSIVYADEFVGKSMPKAAEIVLRRWSPEGYTRPLRTTDLVKALRRGGLNIDGPRALYRSLYGSSRFHGLKGGRWGLREWYPESVLRKSASETPDTTDELDDDEPGSEAAPTENITSFPATPGDGDTADTNQEVVAS